MYETYEPFEPEETLRWFDIVDVTGAVVISIAGSSIFGTENYGHTPRYSPVSPFWPLDLSSSFHRAESSSVPAICRC